MRAVINIALEKTMKLVVFNLWVEMQHQRARINRKVGGRIA